MSTPYNPLNIPSKKVSPRPSPTPGPVDVVESLDYKNIIYDGVSLSIGIIGASFVVRKIDKKFAPQNLNSKSIFTLSFVTILTRAVIEFLGKEGYFDIGI